MPSTLEVRLGQGLPKITRLEAVRYVFNIASGVAYLHCQNPPIVHRDIKPQNILVNEHNARLGDLGLARTLMVADDKENREDVANYIAMPWFYRTPELIQIARGEQVTLTVASDIYQLGLVLYRSVTGFNPQTRPRNALEEIVLDVRQIPGVSGERLDSLVGRMLKTNPEERPPADEVLQKLSLIHKEICQADLEATGMMR